MSRKVLITGGSGLVGSRLSEMLIDLGCEVAHLSRKPDKQAHYRTFRWDIETGHIDEGALNYPDFIVHLAGASIAGGKWTKERKREILDSRVRSTELLHSCLASRTHHVKGFIGTSAVGYYGNTADQEVTEDSPPGQGFLSQVCQQWEAAQQKMRQLGIRTPIFRFGVVLSSEGGALPAIARPVKLMSGATLGSGDQYMSWIHIDDLCRLIIRAMEEKEFADVYNAVAPCPVTNDTFTHVLAQVLHRPIVLPHVPAFALKLVMGELAETVLCGQKVSAARVREKGFRFEYPELRQALESIYGE